MRRRVLKPAAAAVRRALGGWRFGGGGAFAAGGAASSGFGTGAAFGNMDLGLFLSSGGYTGDKTRRKAAGIVHGKEYVFSAPAVAAIGVDRLERMHRRPRRAAPRRTCPATRTAATSRPLGSWPAVAAARCRTDGAAAPAKAGDTHVTHHHNNVTVHAPPGMTRQTAMQRGAEVGRGIERRDDEERQAMSITVFPDVVFRHSVISAGVNGRQIRKNQRVSTANGFESINIVWDRTHARVRHRHDPLQRADWEYIESLHEITEGGAYGFLLEDPKDFHSTEHDRGDADQRADRSESGDGIPAVQALPERRVDPLQGPQDHAAEPGQLRAVHQRRAAGRGAYTLDPTTGRSPSNRSPSASLVTWSGRFYVPVHFQSDVIDWKLEVSGPEEVRYYSGPSVVFEEVRE
jgi:hypothetical protein